MLTLSAVRPAPRQKTDKADLFLYYWKLIAGDMPEPEQEFHFDAHIGRKHRFDFAFQFHLVAVEIEGNAWNVKGGGKHMQERDLEKYNIAAMLGWRILRFSPAMLQNDPDACINSVVEALKWNSTKFYSSSGADTTVNAGVARWVKTPITRLSTISNTKVKRNTKS